jgi:DNA-directed RNA polymerase I, II, and III subunit RPABC3
MASSARGAAAGGASAAASAASSSAAAGAAAPAAVRSWQLFEDLFVVTKLNPEGKKFDKVNRLVARAETHEVDLTLDVASDHCALREADRFTLTLASTLDPSGRPDDGSWDPSGGESLLDRYDYGMAGKVFKAEAAGADRMSLVASFGGLLMLLQGEQRHLAHIELDSRVYCLIRRTR